LTITGGIVTAVANATLFNSTVANFKYIRFGEGITGIANNAFSGNAAFNDANNKKDIEFNANFTSIGNYVFNPNAGLRSISFQRVDSTTSTLSIGNDAFGYCQNLETIAFVGEGNIPNLSIGDRAFANCTKLSDFAGVSVGSIVISNIGISSFGACPSLTYDMLDKIDSVANTTKVKDDSGSKKFIYFQPIDQQQPPRLFGCLVYGEIES
jgi:hypothetical protein